MSLKYCFIVSHNSFFLAVVYIYQCVLCVYVRMVYTGETKINETYLLFNLYSEIA